MKYVGTYSDPKDIVTKDKLEAVTSRVSTNEDNIAMAESDIDGLQTDVGTLKTNVGNIQTALTSKQDTVVGGASTITEDNLTASRALVSNSSGKVAVSDITSTELGYLDGVTSNVQTQLNKKLESAPVISVNGKTGAVQLDAADVGALLNPISETTSTSLTGILKGNGTTIEVAAPGTDYLNTAVFTVTCTKDTDQSTDEITVYTPNCTFDEMLSAYNSGMVIELVCGFIFRLLRMVGTTGAMFTMIGLVANLNTQTAVWSAANNKVNVTKSGLATLDIIYSAIGRNSYVNAGDTNYTTYMARGEALFSSETTPTVNGCIAWQYE
jgi:hypothetical protein